MGKIHKKHLWKNFKPITYNQNDTPPLVFQSRILFIGCAHTKDING